MKGYKGFAPGLICRGKQYAENTVFEEDNAIICESGMHFCAAPLDVLDHYPIINENGELNEFAEVEALDEVETDDNKKYVTKKLKIGGKISIKRLGELHAEYIREVVKANRKDSGNDAKQVGGYSSNQVGGDFAKQVGGYSAKQVGGKNCIMVAGKNSRFKAGLHSVILHYWYDDNGDIAGYKATQVDGVSLKPDIWYTLKDGEFTEVK